MEARAHSRFGGSVAKRYMACPGSVALCDAVPPAPSSIYADEGSAAHELDARCLRENLHPRDYLGCPIKVGERTFDVDPDMCDAVVEHINAVMHEVAQSADGEFYVEHSFVLPLKSAEPGEVHGTADALVWHESLGRLVVFDYKHGVGVSVDATANEQLQFYAAGAVLSHPEWKVRTIECVIVQPRARDVEVAGAIKRYPIDILGLYAFIEELDAAVALAKSAKVGQSDSGLFVAYDGPNPMTDEALHPGDHCRWCDAAAVCPAREQQFLQQAQLSYTDVRQVTVANLPDPRDLDLEQLGRLLLAFDILDGWALQVREYARAICETTPIPHHKLVPTQARAKIVAEPEQVAGYLALMYGVPDDESRPRKLATLTDLLKAVKRAVPKEVYAAAEQDVRARFTVRESTGFNLVPITDGREAVNAVEGHYSGINTEGLQP